MTRSTIQLVTEIEPITFDTDARDLAIRAYDALLSQLADLTDADWAAATDCPGWDVAAMVGHLIGAAQAGASIRENLRQQWWGWRHRADYDGNPLDALNDLQIREQTSLSPTDRIAKLRALAPQAVAGRMRLPRPMRSIPLPMPKGGSTAPGTPAKSTLGALMSNIYTRDTWLHRIDIARATGHPLVPEPVLDSRIVADVVREWASLHGQPFQLTLAGPAGGTFRTDLPGPELSYDAIEFCRILSGRAAAVGLLGVRVVF